MWISDKSGGGTRWSGELRPYAPPGRIPVEKGGGLCYTYQKERAVGFMQERQKWISWAMELQALAQAGLWYGKDVFDRERYTRIREIAAEMVALQTELPPEKVKDLFCGEVGYQTPKLDTRAAIFREGKILLVREKNGTWALPGGWVDVHASVGENVVREAREEAGAEVLPQRLIAVQDRAKHNRPEYIYGICKIFVECRFLGGTFRENSETTACGWFTPENLPVLAEEKNTREQIEMCFRAHADPDWQPLFD